MGNPKMATSSKVALVTGSGKRRVGSYVAETFAARGFAVAVHYRSSAAEAADMVTSLLQQGVPAAAFQADLTDEQAVKSLIARVVAEFGRIDALVNCAPVAQQTP